jgi:diguanylate cyclase (GGDEF)-like protein
VSVNTVILALCPLIAILGIFDWLRSRRRARELLDTLSEHGAAISRAAGVHDETMGIIRRALRNLEQEERTSRGLLESTVEFVRSVIDPYRVGDRALVVLEGATRLLGAREISYYAPTRDGHDLVLRHVSGFGDEEVREVRVRRGEGRVGTTAERGRVMREEDFATEGIPRGSSLLPDVRSCIPLSGWTGLHGVVGVGAADVGQVEERLAVVSGFGGLALENSALVRRAEEETRIDAITKLPNRESALRVLERELGYAQRYGRRLSVSLLAVDSPPGGAVDAGVEPSPDRLKASAKLLAERVRDSDLPARFDEETFLVLLPESAASDAAGMAERLRREFEERASSGEGPGGVEVGTLSGGVASYPEDGETGQRLLARAAEALARARRGGGNRVVSSSELGTPEAPAG